MRRRLFNLGSAVSLLLCIALVELRARSYGVRDDVTRRKGMCRRRGSS